MSPIHRPIIVKLALSKNYYYRSLISRLYTFKSKSTHILIYVHLYTNVAYTYIYIYIYIYTHTHTHTHITEQFLQSNDPRVRATLLQGRLSFKVIQHTYEQIRFTIPRGRRGS